MVGILQNTIIFANNDEDEDMDRECHKIKEKMSAASNYVFQFTQWQDVIMPLLNFIDVNYFISITGKPNDTNKHHLPHCVRVMLAISV